jgi:putative glycosyltransferase
MKLSIVTTLYHSVPYLHEFYARVSAAAKAVTNDYEIIFVNDGSPDNSSETVLSFLENGRDDRVRLIDLSRNFGHHKAIMTGLNYAKGDLVFLIDCDLEEAPELLEEFYLIMQNAKADVVYGVQLSRKGAWFEKISGELFWNLFNLISSHSVVPNQLTARLMKRAYVANLLQNGEREVFLAGLYALTGFTQKPVIVKKHSKGISTYTFRKKVALFVNAITAFSAAPLVFNFYLGLIIILLSLISALYLVFRSLVFGDYIMGWPSLIVSIWFLGGLTIFSLGIIGIYISKIFIETKRRPLTVIRELHNFPKISDIGYYPPISMHLTENQNQIMS